jgi:maltose-binding protein MalE
MESYLAGRGANIDGNDSSQESNSFGSYLSDPNKQHTAIVSPEETESNVDSLKETIHEDESGIKVEVVSVDGTPSKILIQIPDGRIIDLSCEY